MYRADNKYIFVEAESCLARGWGSFGTLGMVVKVDGRTRGLICLFKPSSGALHGATVQHEGLYSSTRTFLHDPHPFTAAPAHTGMSTDGSSWTHTPDSQRAPTPIETHSVCMGLQGAVLAASSSNPEGSVGLMVPQPHFLARHNHASIETNACMILPPHHRRPFPPLEDNK